MVEQEKLFLTELRLCGESNQWRVDVRYTAAMAKQEGAGKNDSQQAENQDDESKKATTPEELRLSILVPAGDRSVVDLQIAAMDRAVALLQATVSAARAEQLQLRQASNGVSGE